VNIPDYPWFGPRHGMGWGWAPVSWEGKLACFAVFVLCLIAYLAFGRSKKTLYIIGGLVVFIVIVAALTGTAPG
jgi:hypothetical protein